MQSTGCLLHSLITVTSALEFKSSTYSFTSLQRIVYAHCLEYTQQLFIIGTNYLSNIAFVAWHFEY